MIEIGVGPSDKMYLHVILVGELEEINLFLNDKPIPHKNTKVGPYKLDGWVHIGGKMMFRLLEYQEDYYHVVQFVDNLFYPIHCFHFVIHRILIYLFFQLHS